LSRVESTSRPQTSIVVVNWNRKALLEQCLASLAAQTCSDFELILADNGSTDGSPDVLERFPLPATTLIRNRENLGYTPAVNQGLRAARGAFIALVNNDVVLDKNWLEEILRGFGQDSSVGMCACKILLAAPPDVIDKAGHLIYPDGQNYGRGHGERDQGQYDRVEESLFPDGAAAAYRAEVFQSAGLFDEDFFAYGDDADLGLRVRLCGWRCLYIPTAVAHHYHSATLGIYSPKKVFLVERNRIWLAAKLFPWRELLLLPFYSAIRYLYSAWALATRRGDVGQAAREGSMADLLAAFLKAQAAALWGLPRMLRKRAELGKRRRIRGKEFRRLLRQHALTAREVTLGKARRGAA